jgi:membrane protein YdbS with pleckstrin-like domain
LNGFLLRVWVRPLIGSLAVLVVGVLIGVSVFYYYNLPEKWVTPAALLIAATAAVVMVFLLYRELTKASSKPVPQSETQ